MNHRALNQLVCAALINDRFREVLLRDPALALATGYHGQSFSLTPEEQNMVVGIRVQKLEDFAAHVHAWISGDDRVERRHGTNGNGHHRTVPAATQPFVDLYRTPVPA